MLTFATEIPLSMQRTADDLLELAKVWLIGSPHRRITRKDLPEPVRGDVVETDYQGQKITIALASENGSELIGFRHTYVDNGNRQWTLELVGNKTINEFWCSVRAYCESLQPIPTLPKSRKPFIVKQILTFGTGMDDGIEVSAKPIILTQSDFEKVISLVMGSRGNRLPIVYISAEEINRYVVDPVKLATKLSGLAHVIVEPSRLFSFNLRDKVNGLNAYAGAVGIYWPGQSGQRQILLPEQFECAEDLASEVVNQVELALINRRPSPTCSWGWLIEVQSRQKIAALKAQGETSFEQFADLYNQEIMAKETRISEAEAEINRLKIENNRLELLSNSRTLLSQGVEVDLYPGERSALLVLILKQSLNNIKPNSRRDHVVRDLLSANEKKQGNVAENLAEAVQKILKGYTSVGKKERRSLEELGFEFISEGNHHKMVFHGDNRYLFTIAKTPSDHRAGLNAASTIKSKLC